MSSITNQQRIAAEYNASELQLHLYGHNSSGERLYSIAEKFQLTDPLTYQKFALIVGDSILNLIKTTDLPGIFISELAVDTGRAMKLSADVIDFLEPLLLDTTTSDASHQAQPSVTTPIASTLPQSNSQIPPAPTKHQELSLPTAEAGSNWSQPQPTSAQTPVSAWQPVVPVNPPAQPNQAAEPQIPEQANQLTQPPVFQTPVTPMTAVVSPAPQVPLNQNYQYQQPETPQPHTPPQQTYQQPAAPQPYTPPQPTYQTPLTTPPPPITPPPSPAVSQTPVSVADIEARMPPLPTTHTPNQASRFTILNETPITPPPATNIQPVRTMEADAERIHGYAAYRQQYPHLYTDEASAKETVRALAQDALLQRTPVVETPRFDEPRG